MPIHNWAAAPTGLFHHFHQTWVVEICRALNTGLLPQDCYALVDQRAVGLIPDLLTLAARPAVSTPAGPAGRGTSVAVARPRTRFVAEAEADRYAARASRVVVRSSGDDLIAVIEIVSPGNKESRAALRSFVEKATDLINRGINLLIVDLLPPGPRDPQGIHKAIWDEFRESAFALPADQPLTLAAYTAGEPIRAWVEPVAVGASLPDMPVFLDAENYALLPLEPTYEATWAQCPERFKRIVAPP